MGYPSNHYISHNAPYYPPETGSIPANSSGAAYRYPPGSSSDWGRERDFDYRRDYDRRAPPPSGTS